MDEKNISLNDLKSEKTVEPSEELHDHANEVLDPDEVEKRIENGEKKRDHKFPFFIVVIVILLMSSSIGFVFYNRAKSFFVGTWIAEIREEEKNEGLEKLEFLVNKNTLTQKALLTANGFEISAETIENLKQNSSTLSKFQAVSSSKKVSNVNIRMVSATPAELKLDELRQDFQKALNDEISKEKAEKQILITRNPDGSINLKIDTELPRKLVKK